MLRVTPPRTPRQKHTYLDTTEVKTRAGHLLKGKHDTLTGFDFRTDPPLPRAKAVRQHCLFCQGANSAEVRRCHIYDCFLWPYRAGSLRKSRLDDPDEGEDEQEATDPEEIQE